MFELGRLIYDYLKPDGKTKVLEIGCKVGILGLMLSHVGLHIDIYLIWSLLLFSSNCFISQYIDQVIGISNLQSDIDTAKAVAEQNKISNAILMNCDVNGLHTCTPFLKGSKSVAVLNVNSVYGKSKLKILIKHIHS